MTSAISPSTSSGRIDSEIATEVPVGATEFGAFKKNSGCGQSSCDSGVVAVSGRFPRFEVMQTSLLGRVMGAARSTSVSGESHGSSPALPRSTAAARSPRSELPYRPSWSRPATESGKTSPTRPISFAARAISMTVEPSPIRPIAQGAPRRILPVPILTVWTLPLPGSNSATSPFAGSLWREGDSLCRLGDQGGLDGGNGHCRTPRGLREDLEPARDVVRLVEVERTIDADVLNLLVLLQGSDAFGISVYDCCLLVWLRDLQDVGVVNMTRCAFRHRHSERRDDDAVVLSR